MDTHRDSDDTLIAAFCEAAEDGERQRCFGALVERHGPMVLGACRRIAGNGTDAEDAAQAVFITLASKARSLRGHPTIGGWLHRVARNVALRQREAAKNRSRYEGNQEAQAMTSPPDGLDDRLRGELRESLDHALDGLAERYRVPLVLHYLEGHSQEEVARLLDLKEGTLASLLSRGRELLRHQLSRKGVTVGALMLVGVLTAEGHAATVPAAFTLATAKAASAVAAGSFSTAAAAGAAAPHVIALTKTSLSGMALVKLTAAATLAASTLSLGTLTVANYTYAVEATPAPVVVTLDPPAPPKPSDPQNLDQSGAEEAVRSAIRALRTNDANAFLRRLPEAEQQAANRAWRQIGLGDGNPWVSGMVNRVLRASTATDGADQVSNFVSPFLAMAEPQMISQQIKELNGDPVADGDRRRGGLARMIVQSGIAAVASGLLATGFETEQVKALERWFDALADWMPTSGLNEPTKSRKAAEGLAAALSKLGATNLEELGKLDLPQFLDRVALAMPELKRVLSVYGLELDQALDSVQIASRDLPPENTTPGVNARLVTVTFNAFGGTHVLPLKLVETGGRWQVAADSPVTAWLRPRMGDVDMRMFGAGGGQRGDRGQRGGPPRGPRGEAPATSEPAPAPEANPGF
ncbi:MAG: RNA polymerase sigma factor [Planctomycetes bacterium]|nr:RNA polymerase sigma factor [Planctomycetota bacterium]